MKAWLYDKPQMPAQFQGRAAVGPLHAAVAETDDRGTVSGFAAYRRAESTVCCLSGWPYPSFP
jgi:hypothetical protein